MNRDDPRIVAGMGRQGELLRERLAEGARVVGYKAGLGAAAAMDRLGTSAPVAGFMTNRTQLADGTRCSSAGWSNPAFEPELAVRLGADVPAGAGAEQALAAIDGIAAAIELVDLAPPDDLAEVLAGDIFHRGFAVGPFIGATGTAVDAARLDVLVDGEPRAEGVDPADVLGPIAAIVAALADQLPLAGAAVAAGDLIITGSAIPPIVLGGPARLEVRLAGGGSTIAVAVSP